MEGQTHCRQACQGHSHGRGTPDAGDGPPPGRCLYFLMDRATIACGPRWSRAAPVLAAALLLAAVPAEADVFGIAWDPQGHHARTLLITPGGFVELCTALDAGQAVEWRFDASTPTDFNIHFHDGPRITTPAQRPGVRQAQGRLPVASAHEYCWMWTNKSSAKSELRVDLRRQRSTPVAATRSGRG